jgi:hypothetical protein
MSHASKSRSSPASTSGKHNMHEERAHNRVPFFPFVPGLNEIGINALPRAVPERTGTRGACNQRL